MKHSRYVALALLGNILLSCNKQSNYSVELQTKIDSLSRIVASQQQYIITLKDSISLLQFPADQRLLKIKDLIAEQNFAEAKTSIANLQSVFPHSKEATECSALIEEIDNQLAAIKLEQERIKAQGFKVFRDNLTCSDNEENYAFSGFTFGRTYTFDYCPDVDEYWYRTADKDNTYLLFSLRMSTRKKYASPPSIYIYEVVGDKLKQLTSCMEEYANWTSYGAKLGNYRDDSHDFSKVNSVNYKFAGEIDQSLKGKPLFVLFAKNGFSLDAEMSVEQVLNNCIVIKILNRNAI